MSIATAHSSPYPNLLFVAPALDQLEVFACLATRRDLQILWQERCTLPALASLQSRLAEIGKLHVIPPETRTVLLVPPGVGGLFACPSTPAACANPVWCMRQLELTVPFRNNDIRYIVRYQEGMAHFFWVPVSWLDSQISLFNKLGLKLSELYPRALMLESSSSSSGYSGMLQEKLGRGEYLYEFNNGHVCQAALLSAGGELPLSQTATPCQGQPNWEAGLPVLWQNTALSMPVTTGRWSLWAPFFRIATAMLVVLAVLIGFLNWQIVTKEEELTKAMRERRSVVDSAKRFTALEQKLRSNEAIVTASKKLNVAQTPLTLLAQLSRILPKKAWIQQMTFDGKGIVVSGKGMGDEELISVFQDAGFLVEKTRQEPIVDSNDFRLRISEKPKSAETASGGAS